jgi:hypothetical protein
MVKNRIHVLIDRQAISRRSYVMVQLRVASTAAAAPGQ